MRLICNALANGFNRRNENTAPYSQGPISRGVMEGIAGMRQGGRRIMVVPPEIGFGNDG